MPWSKDDYPASMKNMDPDVRDEAIDIANALLEEEGYDEGRAIRIAQSQAKKKVKGESAGGQGGGGGGHPPQHVVPHGDEWAIITEGSDQATKTFDNKQAAEERGRELAEKQNTDLVLHDEEGEEQQHENYS